MLNSTVCIAKEDCYNDNNGAYTMFYMWDGEQVTTQGGMYSDLAHDAYSVDATLEQKRAASIYIENVLPETMNYNKYLFGGLGGNTLVGCTVTLKGSRKAPNNTPLEVVGHDEGGFNGRYNEPERIAVLVNGVATWVKASCFHKLVKGVKELPFWYVSQQDLQDAEKRDIQAEIDTYHAKALNLDKVYTALKEAGDTTTFKTMFDILYKAA